MFQMISADQPPLPLLEVCWFGLFVTTFTKQDSWCTLPYLYTTFFKLEQFFCFMYPNCDFHFLIVFSNSRSKKYCWRDIPNELDFWQCTANGLLCQVRNFIIVDSFYCQRTVSTRVSIHSEYRQWLPITNIGII